jgi:molybdate transport system substrate-binding protein
MLLALLGCTLATTATSDEALFAVAASFVPPLRAVADRFAEETPHTIRIASGSTGALYAQIVNGAPFDVFVSADAERPALLEAAGRGVAGTRSTVARGRLVLLGAHELEALTDPTVRRIAIANPAVAPYGLAARQTLEALGLWEPLATRIVRGESVAQTYAMIATGNAELGFVALAQVLAADSPGDYIIVPEQYYAPIHQDVIVLDRARDNPAARAAAEFLRSDAAKTIIRRYGYATDAP